MDKVIIPVSRSQERRLAAQKSITAERLAEILEKCTIDAPIKGAKYPDLLIAIAAELLKVVEVREKETPKEQV